MLYLRWEGDGAEIVEALRTQGLDARWDGDALRAIAVHPGRPGRRRTIDELREEVQRIEVKDAVTSDITVTLTFPPNALARRRAIPADLVEETPETLADWHRTVRDYVRDAMHAILAPNLDPAHRDALLAQFRDASDPSVADEFAWLNSRDAASPVSLSH